MYMFSDNLMIVMKMWTWRTLGF